MLGCFAAFSCERVFAACLGRNHSHTPVSKMLWLVNVDTQVPTDAEFCRIREAGQFAELLSMVSVRS